MKKIIISSIAIVSALIMGGCSKFGEINTNPDKTTMGNSGMLATGLLRTMTTCAGNGDNKNYVTDDFLSKYIAWTESSDIDLMFNKLNNASFSDIAKLVNATKMVEAAPTEGLKKSYQGLAHFVRVMTFYNATMRVGDIPYSEAGTGNTAPKYDSQKDIYYTVFNELKEAAEILGKHLEGQEFCGANNDLIFGGDTDKWIKFANSLRLRYALRIAYKDPAKAKTEGEAALKGGVMASNEDNAYVRIDASGSWGHPLYMICQWNCFTMSKTMENIFKNSSTVEDPRMPLWFGPSVGWWQHQKDNTTIFNGEKFSGVPNGLSDKAMLAVDEDGYAYNDPNNNSCVYGLQAFPDWHTSGELGSSKVKLNFKVMNYAETCQLKAEAALRGWDGAGDIKANYEAGIRASFAEERAPIADATLYSTANDETYITTGWVKWDNAATDEEKLERIITQKWISLYPNGIEAWAECRRTGYPELMPVQQSEDPDIKPANGEFIKKIRYSDVERRENAANATDPSLNEGQGDGQAVRVWWDTERYK
jgi:hypothetical protein